MPTPSLVPLEVKTVKQVCEHLQVSRTWLYEEMDSGRLKYSKFGRMRRITVEALNEFIESNQAGSEPA